MYYLYLITNSVNNKNYVGYTSKTPEKRFAQHIKEASENSTRALCKALNKYGTENFSLRYMGSAADKEQAKLFEQRFIFIFGSFGAKGYNMNPGGIGGDTSQTPGYIKAKSEGKFRNTLRKHDPEHVEKRASALRNKKRSKEITEKMIATRLANGIVCGPLKGIQFSDDHIKNLSIAAINRPKKSCLHCNKMVDQLNYKKWHGDNCKLYHT